MTHFFLILGCATVGGIVITAVIFAFCEGLFSPGSYDWRAIARNFFSL